MDLKIIKLSETNGITCRLCMRVVSEAFLEDIFANDTFQLSNQIFECTSVLVSQDDNLPNKICKNCKSFLQIASGFRAVTLKTNVMLIENMDERVDSKDWEAESSQSILESCLNLLMNHTNCVDACYNLHMDGKDEFIFVETESYEGEAIKEEITDEVVEDKPSLKHQIKKESDAQSKRLRKVNNEEKRIRKPRAGQDVEPVRKKYVRKNVHCHICFKQMNNYKLTFHLYQHENYRPFKCDFEGCVKTFCSPTLRNRHKLVWHTDYVYGRCPICDKGFKEKGTLDNHVLGHGEPLVQCTLCEKKYKNKKGIRKHMLSHTGEKKHKCEICGKRYQVPYTLRVHMRSHTNENPYPCSLCDQTFRYKCTLKKHTEKLHPDDFVKLFSENN